MKEVVVIAVIVNFQQVLKENHIENENIPFNTSEAVNNVQSIRFQYLRITTLYTLEPKTATFANCEYNLEIDRNK